MLYLIIKPVLSGAIVAAVQVAELDASIWWFILPSLATFVALPWLFRSGMVFWRALPISVAAALVIYACRFAAAPKIGIKL